MSRRSSRSRAAKYYTSRSPWEEPPRPRPSRTVVAESRPLRPLERRALRVFEHLRDTTPWVGDPTYGGHTTNEIRAALGMHPPAKFLSEALTEMRVRGLLHFEFDTQPDGILRWWRTDAGIEALTDDAE